MNVKSSFFKLSIILEKSYILLFVTFFCFVLYWIFDMNGYLIFKNKNHFTLIMIVALIFILLIGYSMQNVKDNKIRNYVLLPLLLFTISFFLRFVTLELLGTETIQRSDFLLAYETSQKYVPVSSPHHRIFSSWAMYIPFLKVIGKCLSYNLFCILVVNCIINSLSAVLSYYIGYLTINRKTGIIIALLFAFCPTMLLQQLLLTPEIPNIFFMLLFILLLILAYRSETKLYKKLILYGLAGSSLAIAGFFKSIDKIAIIALLIIIVISLIRNFKSVSYYRNYLKKYMYIAITLILSYVLIIQVGYRGLDYYFNGSVNRNVSWHYLYVGLNPHGNGSINKKSGSVYSDYAKANHFDYKYAQLQTKKQLLKELQEKSLNVDFFINKAILCWAHYSTIGFTITTINSESEIINIKEVTFPLYYITLFYYGFLIACMIVGSIKLLLHKKEAPTIIKYSTLMVLGFAVLLLITEAQSRYRIVIYPYIYILAGYSLVQVISFLKDDLLQRRPKNYNFIKNIQMKYKNI